MSILDDVGRQPVPGKGGKKPKKNTWADVMITNSGGIRAGIPKGNVTVGTVLTIMPFGNIVVQTPMKGQELLSSIQAVISGRRPEDGRPVPGFIQSSGLRFTYSRSLNATNGTLIKAEIQDKNRKWRRISPDRTYSVVTTDFLLNGGDNIFVKQNRTDSVTYLKHDEIFMDYIKRTKVLKPLLDGRIRNVAAPALSKREDDHAESIPGYLRMIYPLGNQQLLEDYRRLQN